jgi:hypothetical protein
MLPLSLTQVSFQVKASTHKSIEMPFFALLASAWSVKVPRVV